MDDFRYGKMEELSVKHKCIHEGYEYFRRDFVPRGHEGKTSVIIYEVPPKKSAFPYHYHLKNEETFYILSGEGLLKTHDGERRVKAGDMLFFPANSNGAHKLTNVSETENLVYIDFDVVYDMDVALYPDSGKIGIWGKDTNRIYDLDSDVDYYKGE